MIEKFGKTESEESLADIQICRDIVKVILEYGVSQNQILMIIQFLGAELERHEHMVEVVSLARELLKDDSVLLIDKAMKE